MNTLIYVKDSKLPSKKGLSFMFWSLYNRTYTACLIDKRYDEMFYLYTHTAIFIALDQSQCTVVKTASK